jgi:hypothetical protein
MTLPNPFETISSAEPDLRPDVIAMLEAAIASALADELAFISDANELREILQRLEAA